MKCTVNLSSRLVRPVLLIVISTLLFHIYGCTESVRKVSYVSDDSAVAPSLSPNEELTTLQKKTPQELVTEGFIYLSNKNIKIAELHFVTAINKDSDNVDAYIGLGHTQMLKGNHSGAQISFAKASEIDPESAPALVGEAQALRAENKLNSAIKKVNAAMEVDPDNIIVLRELAMIYDLMGKENLSEPLYLEIVEKAPDQASNHNNLGLNYMVRGQYPEAILAFLRALELDRDNDRIKNNLASAYLLNGDELNAFRIFQGTVGEAGAYNNIGYLYMTQGELDKAEEALNKAMRLNPQYYLRAQDNLDKLQQLRKAAELTRN